MFLHYQSNKILRTPFLRVDINERRVRMLVAATRTPTGDRTDCAFAHDLLYRVSSSRTFKVCSVLLFRNVAILNILSDICNYLLLLNIAWKAMLGKKERIFWLLN